MATFAMTDCRVEINSVNMSAMAKKVTITASAEELEDTAFGDSYKSRIGGLRDWSYEVEFNQDFAASQVDVTLFPLLGTVVTVKAKPVNTTTAPTNPEYSGSVLVSDYSPLDGSVGDLAGTKVKWNGAGTLSRATS